MINFPLFLTKAHLLQKLIHYTLLHNKRGTTSNYYLPRADHPFYQPPPLKDTTSRRSSSQQQTVQRDRKSIPCALDLRNSQITRAQGNCRYFGTAQWSLNIKSHTDRSAPSSPPFPRAAAAWIPETGHIKKSGSVNLCWAFTSSCTSLIPNNHLHRIHLVT